MDLPLVAVEIVPVEVVLRNRAAGSLCRQLPIEDVAAAAGTIAYEILSRIPTRVLREQRGG